MHVLKVQKSKARNATVESHRSKVNDMKLIREKNNSQLIDYLLKPKIARNYKKEILS